MKSLLKKAGFSVKPAKGNHSKWQHPQVSQIIVISGNDGSDAKPYLEKQVNSALEILNKINQEDN
ncbi:type II toxin-antitoxin system HicA family toxin [Geminocystis sp. GBBB08]|uniref:type II toxin-antitoxin system HicA family toxin n=1 Tax=Geminocystis sp. GBBB08 TaxID=2604140 RepID=UPI0027E397BC|nr:type II toxin-antitoxin system HicA family toxin [Geminocystis sp. GBBB08]